MCPHYKLEWFRSHQYSQSDIENIEKLVYSTFEHLVIAPTNSQDSPNTKSSSNFGPNTVGLHAQPAYWFTYCLATSPSLLLTNGYRMTKSTLFQLSHPLTQLRSTSALHWFP
jgi:hypothetical protein